MSSIFMIVDQGQNSLWRARDNQRVKEILDQSKSLEDKLAEAGIELKIDKEAQTKAAQSVATLEEARRVGNPKAAAQERLERVERQIKEIREEMRLAQAGGDRAKVAKLAQEAAKLAREIGKAAAEFSTGMANETAMAKDNASAPAATVGDAAVTGDAAAANGSASTDAASAPVAPVQQPAPLPVATAPAQPGVPAPGSDVPATPATNPGSDKGSLYSSLSAMIGDSKGMLSRWKEGDDFARRSDLVLSQIRSVMKDAKRSADEEESAVRRQTRRRAVEQGEKDLATAQDAVNGVRGAANPTASDTAEALTAALMKAVENTQTQIVVLPAGSVPPSVNMLA